MISPKHFLPLLLLSLTLYASSQNCIISGTASDYAGLKVPVSVINNPVTLSRTEIDTIQFDIKGSFRISLDLDEMTVLIFDLGTYEGFLYAEPGLEYKLNLPPLFQRSWHNKINLYFKPVEVHLKVTECRYIENKELINDELKLNNILFSFDTLFSKTNETIIESRQSRSYMNSDSILEAFEQIYSKYDSPFFKRYRRYRYGILMINEGKTGLEDLTTNYLFEREPRINEPAYMKLFNAIFDDFFLYFGQTRDGRDISNCINRQQSLQALRYELRKHPALFSDTIADLVILREISQQYYNNSYIKDALLIILDSLSAGAVVQDYRIIAGEMFEEFSKLMIGNRPPQIWLRDQQGEYTNLAQFEGKYVYLYFCTPDNYSCMTEYPFLKSFHQKHDEYLEVITIMVSKEYSDMVSFMDQNQYKWKALFYEDQPGLLKQYNVRLFPTTFLIGPDGNLIQSPGTLPSEGFQQQLFRIMRARGDI